MAGDIQLQRFRAWAYGIPLPHLEADSWQDYFTTRFMGLRKKPPPVVKAKTKCESAKDLKLKTAKIPFKTNEKNTYCAKVNSFL